MSSNQTGQLLRHAPYLPVSNVEQTMTFYAKVLGFRSEYSAGAPLQFAIRDCDGHVLGFGEALDGAE